MNSLRILIIISLIADNNKDFLTLTSTYIQHLLRLKSWTKQLSTVSKILKAWYSKCDFLYLSFPNMSTTHFSSQLCLIKGHRFLKKYYKFFLSLLTLQKRWNILFSSEKERFFQITKYRSPSKITRHVCWLGYTGYQSPHRVNSIITCTFLTNKKVWKEVPLRDFKFMRTFPLVRAQVFCIRNWRYFKVYLELL